MAVPAMIFEKSLTAADRNDRLSVPAKWRDRLFPPVAENGKVSIRAFDERGDEYEFVMKVRRKRTKPEFMARGWQKFVRKRKLLPDDIVFFSRGEFPDVYRVEVQEVGPTLQLALVPTI